MTTDEQTIAVYDAKVGEYTNAFSAAANDPALLRFINLVTKGASVLDLGCGPGTHAAAMHKYGLNVTATDASSAMVKEARRHEGIEVRQAEFNDLNERGMYDGIWANFSLLHALRGSFPEILSRIATALKPGGVFHLGLKTGAGEKRDNLGRRYTFYTPAEAHKYLQAAGFRVIEETSGKSVGLAGTDDPWIEILGRLDR